MIKEVARGGMGEVWLAERADGSLKRSVALKLPILAMRRSVLVQRFERERDILAALVHPNIARLYDAGFAADGQPYLAMEYVEGLPITQYCEQRKLDRSSRIQLLLQGMRSINPAPYFEGSDVIDGGRVCAVAQPGGSAMFQGSSAS